VRLLDELERVFVPGRPDVHRPPGEEAAERGRRRYDYAAKRLREAGIKTTPDERAAADLYASLRQEWDPYVKPLAMYMGHDPGDIDAPGSPHDDPFSDGAPQ